ncbi:MAG: hypothetical protein KC912_19050 [Proteobacteria bacterium]|nr:hypothetical protein [Pseudomonadota bacterium]
MSPLLLVLASLAPVWAETPVVEEPASPVWTEDAGEASSSVEDSPWQTAGPWDVPTLIEGPPTPLRSPINIAPWWLREPPNPWGVAAGTAAPAEVTPWTGSAPTPEPGWEQAAGADEAGWGDSPAADTADEAGWGDAADEAGWGDEADDAGWGDAGDTAGFGDAPPTTPAKSRNPMFTFGGALETRESLWMERLGETPLASAKQSVDLEARFKKGIFRGKAAVHAEADLAYWFPQDRWDGIMEDKPTFRTYGRQLLPREVWLSASPGDFEFSAGRQKVAWGEGLLLSPMDVISPRDMREPGLADLEDLRLPVTMVRAGWYPGSHRFELYYVPEFDIGFRSPPQGPYGGMTALVDQAPDINPSDLFEDPTGGLLGGLIDYFFGDEFDEQVETLLTDKAYTYEHQQPRWKASQAQVFGRWRYSGNGIDVALYGGTLIDKQGAFSFPELQTFIDEDVIRLKVDHYRYSSFGHSGAAPIDKLLLRWELAVDLNKPYNTADWDVAPPELSVGRGDLATGMVGVGMNYIPNTTVDFEVSQGVFLKNPGELITPADTTNWGLRVGWTGMRERLRLGATGLAFGTDGRYGSLARLDASYALRDGLWATVGGITYQPGRENGPLIGLDTHDQLFGQLRWSF